MSNATPANALKSRLNFAARVITTLLLSTFLVLSDDQRAAVAQALRDPLSILTDRSPGARDAAKLRQTKAKREIVLPEGENLLDADHVVAPDELAFEPSAFPDNGDATLLASLDMPGDIATDMTGGAARWPRHRGGLGGGGFMSFIPGGRGGGGENAVGVGDLAPDQGYMQDGIAPACNEPGDCRKPEPQVTLPIPEPGTWLMLLIGFFALGGLVRMARLSRRSARLASGAADRPRGE